MKKIKFFLLLIILINIFYISFAQGDDKDEISLRIDQINAKNFPRMEAYVSVVENYGDNKDEPVLSLVRGNFKTLIDGDEVKSIKVEGFQYTEEPIVYAVLLSSNGMMDGGPIEFQQKATVTLMESLRDQDRLSLFLFGEEVKSVFEYQKKDETLLEKISKVEILGFNPHLYDALITAARHLEKSDIKRKVIIIMTDGREVGSSYTQDQMYNVVNELNIPVYSIGMRLMAGQNLHRIIGISEKTGGGYVYSGNFIRVPDQMKKIINQVNQGYKIKFKATKVKGDDDIHQLEIRVNSDKGKSGFFKNFIAAKIPFPLWAKIVIIVVIVLLLIALVILIIFIRQKVREKLGITKRKCPKCKKRMKDDWDECIFCKYMKPKKKKKEKYD